MPSKTLIIRGSAQNCYSPQGDITQYECVDAGHVPLAYFYGDAGLYCGNAKNPRALGYCCIVQAFPVPGDPLPDSCSAGWQCCNNNCKPWYAGDSGTVLQNVCLP